MHSVILYDVYYHTPVTNRIWVTNRTRNFFSSVATQRTVQTRCVYAIFFFFSVRPSTQRSRLGGPRRSFPETFNSQRKLLNCQVSSSIYFYPGKACVLSGWHMMEGGAYGASFAGGAFDFQSFLKLPQTILRLLSWVSHTEALACRTSQLSHQEFSWTHVCRYRPNKPCNSG